MILILNNTSPKISSIANVISDVCKSRSFSGKYSIAKHNASQRAIATIEMLSGLRTLAATPSKAADK